MRHSEGVRSVERMELTSTELGLAARLATRVGPVEALA